ncbi:hypothetical protein NDU88_006152 [Pleurodeles waltl]|uniref:Uncharacterized protein n=1 Tax=Pleurodeles waltl TaxID=8319 RepID=A0AAV7X3D3_PLEWA|nr:hypothetical protein NDU88_006152 [Pleurodeles waltl]
MRLTRGTPRKKRILGGKAAFGPYVKAHFGRRGLEWELSGRSEREPTIELFKHASHERSLTLTKASAKMCLVHLRAASGAGGGDTSPADSSGNSRSTSSETLASPKLSDAGRREQTDNVMAAIRGPTSAVNGHELVPRGGEASVILHFAPFYILGVWRPLKGDVLPHAVHASLHKKRDIRFQSSVEGKTRSKTQ